MNIFTIFEKSEPTPAPEISDEQRLEGVENERLVIEAELRAAVAAVATHNAKHESLLTARTAILNGRLHFRLNAMHLDRERQQLESKCDQLIRERSDILGERAGLLLRLGLIR